MRSDELDRALLEMLQALVARAPLFAQLRARGQADDLVQDALLAVSRRMARGDVDDPHAYATRVVQNLARRAYVRGTREDASPVELLEGAGPAVDVAAVAEQRFELAEVLEMVRAVTTVVRELPSADIDLVRAELCRDDQRALARRMGMSRAAFYRRKRDVVCGFVNAVAHRARAQPCPDRVEALLAAAGGSGFASARRAREHAAGCRDCATTLRHLTAARHGLGMLAPLPALSVAGDVGVAERIVASAHGAVDWVRGVVVRAPDPVAMLPASKTAAAAVAAACIGVGGTTYCVVDGVPRTVKQALGVDEPTKTSRPRADGARASAGARRRASTPVRVPQQASAKRAAASSSAPAAAVRPRRRTSGSAEAEFRRAPKKATTAEFSPSTTAVSASTQQVTSAAPSSGAAEREFAAGGDSGGEFGP